MSIDPKKYVDVESEDTPIIVYRDKDAVIAPLEVVPSTEQQTIEAPDAIDGYNPITVRAVNATIDSNITPNNIVRGVSILGVNGSYDGIIPTGTKSITANGTYDVSEFASAEVNVVQSKYGITFDAWIGDVDSSGMPRTNMGSGTPNFVGVVDAPSWWLANKFAGNTNLTGIVNFPNLLRITGTNAFNSAFKGCTGLTGVSMPLLKQITSTNSMAEMFSGCSGITTLDFSSLETISSVWGFASCFTGCTSLTSVNLSSLKTVNTGNALQFCFLDCSNLSSVDLSSLEVASGSNCFYNAFKNCTSLKSLSFPALKTTSFGSYTNQFANMLLGCTDVTVHFPSNLQSVIGSWTDVVNGFGGTNTTVSFDLPATE